MTIVQASEFAAALLPESRTWLRRSSGKLDDEIQQTTAAAFLDMSNVGITKLNAEDPLIKQAVKLYLKAHFGYDDQPEKWETSYERLKSALSLSSAYTEKED